MKYQEHFYSSFFSSIVINVNLALNFSFSLNLNSTEWTIISWRKPKDKQEVKWNIFSCLIRTQTWKGRQRWSLEFHFFFFGRFSISIFPPNLMRCLKTQISNLFSSFILFSFLSRSQIIYLLFLFKFFAEPLFYPRVCFNVWQYERG